MVGFLGARGVAAPAREVAEVQPRFGAVEVFALRGFDFRDRRIEGRHRRRVRQGAGTRNHARGFHAHRACRIAEQRREHARDMRLPGAAVCCAVTAAWRSCASASRNDDGWPRPRPRPGSERATRSPWRARSPGARDPARGRAARRRRPAWARRPASIAAPKCTSCRRPGPYHVATASAAHCACRLRWQPVQASGVPSASDSSGRGTRKPWSRRGSTTI